MGWGWIIGTVALALLALWRFGQLKKSALELSIAALLLAVAGYALQGSPSVPGSPTTAPADINSAEVPADLRKGFASSMNAEGQWLALADALMQAGRSRAAVSILSEGSRKAPQNPDIWVGLGNALFVHGGGQMNPAAQYAFERAAQIAPNHPGPPFFLGFALMRAGKMEEAGEVWRALLARAPKDAPWRADLVARLTEINQLSAAPPKVAPQTAN
jgi:cytochrome c-type biogenesis protein CcmH